jgi:hypothetical protein
MSQLGQKRTRSLHKPMSALPPIAAAKADFNALHRTNSAAPTYSNSASRPHRSIAMARYVHDRRVVVVETVAVYGESAHATSAHIAEGHHWLRIVLIRALEMNEAAN